jgi:hypothetical protein
MNCESKKTTLIIKLITARWGILYVLVVEEVIGW